MAESLNSARDHYAPIRDLLDHGYCYTHMAALKLRCDLNITKIAFSSKVARGYPALFQSKIAVRRTVLENGVITGKLTSAGELHGSLNISPLTSAPISLELRSKMSPGGHWGAYQLACIWPNKRATVVVGASTVPSLLCSLFTAKERLGFAGDLELDMKRMRLRKYDATVSWTGANWLVCAMHESGETGEARLGSLRFANRWNISDSISVAGQLQYESASQQFVSTVGVRWSSPLLYLRAKLDSEGYVSLSAERTLSPSVTLRASCRFDASHLQGQRDPQLGFRLTLSPTYAITTAALCGP